MIDIITTIYKEEFEEIDKYLQEYCEKKEFTDEFIFLYSIHMNRKFSDYPKIMQRVFVSKEDAKKLYPEKWDENE